MATERARAGCCDNGDGWASIFYGKPTNREEGASNARWRYLSRRR